jgi:hypothetical protein
MKRTILGSALVKRTNRKLTKEGSEVLRKFRSRYHWHFTPYYITDWYTNTQVASEVDIEDLGKGLGVLSPS